MLKRLKHSKKRAEKDCKDKKEFNIDDLLKALKPSKDFQRFEFKAKSNTCWISFIKTMVNPDFVHRDVLAILTSNPFNSLEEIQMLLPIEQKLIISDVREIQKKVMAGSIMIQLNEHDADCLLISAVTVESRQVAMPEVEFTVVGPKEAFVESLDVNINLIRKRLPLPQLQMRELEVGKISNTRVAVMYIDGLANQENINTIMQRISDIEYDHIIDSSYITQMISDNKNSPFPQMLDTERPDRVSAVLTEGKIAILVDGSPHALYAPITIVEFFSAFEDYFQIWHMASLFRLIRLFAVTFSVFSTPFYVAILTYHYEMIPMNLLATLISSRADVPFPPILEVLILEVVIELLREAGARLPTKVGQTIGIVGGIVIGTASVDAGLTSSILLIIVALAALASFTTPVYQMSNTIRLIRFPFLLFAQLWGLIGIAIFFAVMVGHLLSLTSMGRPFIEPIFPPRLADLKDAFFRMPFNRQAKRPIYQRPEDPMRANPQRINEKHDNEK
ncbi:spore germination protein [Cytobacillus firmus]|nr:spore germination protein [Cytobacillus firmus]